MPEAYADDAAFLARVPAAFATEVTSAERQAALEDAEEFVSLDVFGGKATLAHVYYAAHLLLCRFPTELASVGGGSTGEVTSMRAGEIAATFAVAAPASEDSPSTTKYGKRYLEIAGRVIHPLEAV